MQNLSIITITDLGFAYPSSSSAIFEHLSATLDRGWTALLGDTAAAKPPWPCSCADADRRHRDESIRNPAAWSANTVPRTSLSNRITWTILPTIVAADHSHKADPEHSR